MHTRETEMLHNPITKLTNQLIDHFAAVPVATNTTAATGTTATDLNSLRFRRVGELVRHHSEDISEMGDISVAGSKINWLCFTQRHGLELRTQTDSLLPDEKSVDQLLEHSKKWLYPLLRVSKLRKERFALHFQRAPIIANVLGVILEQGDNYGKCKKSVEAPSVSLSLHEQFTQLDYGRVKELHKFRAKQFLSIVRRLMDYTNYRLVDSVEEHTIDTLHISVECNNQSRRSPAEEAVNRIRLICGPVLEPTKKTVTLLTSSSYMDLRSNDMLLIAMHRHGVRDCAKGAEFKALMERLGHAAVIVDLFEVRHGTAATVVRNGLGSSKGANYVLYNSARLETLLRTFEDRVNNDVYEPLPPLETIDLSVLEDELDWQLIYGYLLSFPELVASTLGQLEQGQCAVHLLVRYIVNLASLFSRYYRNKQILVQKRNNLMPVLYARIYLVKAVRQVLNSALSLLGIEPVDYM